MSKKQKQEEVTGWDDEKIRLQEVRRKRGIFCVSSEYTEYHKVISEARAKLEKCASFAGGSKNPGMSILLGMRARPTRYQLVRRCTLEDPDCCGQ